MFKQGKIFFLFILLLLLPLVLTAPMSSSVVETTQATDVQDIPLEFAHTEDVTLDLDNTVEATEFNGSEFLDQLDTFNTTAVSVYTGTDEIPDFSAVIPGGGPLYYLTINITEIYIFDAQETILQGNGEIYFFIWGNGNYTRYPVSGYISASDDTTIPLAIIAYEGWCWNGTVAVEVWEDDQAPDEDDFLGRMEYSSTDLGTSQELAFNTVDPGPGHAIVTVNFTSSPTTKTSYTAQELLTGYKPYLYIDDETSGTEEADGVYGRVCIGYDEEKATELWALQYFFFWEIETYGTSVTEVQLHKYDYEEFLIYLDPADIRVPVRIVYDQAQNPAYPDHEFTIFEHSPTATGTFQQTINFSEPLQPFLGTNLTIDYVVNDLVSIQPDFIEGLFGSQTLQLTIDTFYHAFDSGVGSNETAYDYTIATLSNGLLKEWYSHLNESIHGTIVHVPIIDYTTPQISPFTFDVSTPFQRPYLINAWANVMDDLDAFKQAQTQDITLSANLNLTLKLAVEALLSIEYPTMVEPGESYELSYSIEMYDDTVILTVEYELGLNISTNFWFLGGEFILYQNGSFSIDIPLGTINSLLDAAGVSHQSLLDRVVEKVNTYLTSYYLEIDQFVVSPTLLGTVVNASISLHCWDIVKDFLPQIVLTLVPEVYPIVNTVFKVLDRIISYIDLQAVFLVQAIVTGDIEVTNTGLAAIDVSDLEFDESAASVPVTLTIATNPSTADFQVSLSNLANGMNFFIDWYFNAGLEQPFSYFISDFEVKIGRFPSLQRDFPEGWVEANITSIDLDFSISGITYPTTTTTTTTTTAGTTPSWILIDIIGIFAFLLLGTRKRERK